MADAPSPAAASMPPPASAWHTHATALTTRLVAGYVLVALITLSSGAAFLYHRLYESFEEEDTEFLDAHINTLRAEMAKVPTNIPAAKELIAKSHTYRTMDALFGQIRTIGGKVIVEAPGFNELVPDDSAFPPPIRKDEELTNAVRYRTSPSSPMLLLASAEVRREQTNVLLIYRVALDVSHIDDWMREFRNELIWVVLAGTTLSGILAWLITRRGLRPLHQITAAMKRVGASGLDERLGHNPWPRELADTAGEFDLMLERLREAFHRLTQFSADAAHELRTPLNGLMISTSLMLAQDRDSEEYRHALATNLEEYERLKRMVDSLLFIARADNAEAVLKRSNVNMATLGAEVLDFFSALAEERHVTLRVVGQGTAYGDVTLLRLALSNLVSNALRHTPSGGSVQVTIGESREFCRIDVSDTGTGIPAEHLPKLFDRFYRVDAARTVSQEDGGTGLGLALVKTVVHLHGGTITVISNVGSGTTMTLTFPSGGGSQRQEDKPAVENAGEAGRNLG
ncbi:heavy metal sensor histidine kinase [Roseimicrobium sp. ORNL1]|uniref:heavy metal sensor histidine kinase n=1 Tax=Roseimicrobium sp. ORNL1 TaxID=2711231 RepID=UPI0013E12131|nr:heavy metal sensor histidine kinase [Roseimicrobium sp. ORNL1]QIF00502.1 heavy metal sensor histidine kinase [Roseimicrobium sp. ORNL1]